MSMAREEAIKAFEEIRENAQNNLGAKWAHGCDGYYRDKIELADVVLSALRPSAGSRWRRRGRAVSIVKSTKSTLCELK